MKWSLPPFPSTSLPLWPGPLLSPPLQLPPSLCFRAPRAPRGWARCILYYSFMYFKRQTHQFVLNPFLFSSTSPSFLSCVATSLLQVYKSLSRPDWQRTGGPVENTGDGEKSWHISEMKINVEYINKARYGKTTIKCHCWAL